MARAFWYLLDDARWRAFVAPVRNRREAEAVLLSMFGDKLREVEPRAKGRRCASLTTKRAA